MAQPRQPKGIKSGGQFATTAHHEACATLTDVDRWHTTQNLMGGERMREWLDDDGLPDRTPDGSPSRITYYAGGSVDSEEYFAHGILDDPPDGTPASRTYRRDGGLDVAMHYRDGLLHDPDDGSPAMVGYGPSGEVTFEAHFDHGNEIVES